MIYSKSILTDELNFIKLHSSKMDILRIELLVPSDIYSSLPILNLALKNNLYILNYHG